MNDTSYFAASERRNRIGRAFIWSAGVAALIYLAAVHRPHLLEWLPYLVILACPLMHVYLHRAHGHKDHLER